MHNYRMRKCVIAAAICGFGAGAGSSALANSVELDTITVKGEGMREADRSFTVNTITREQIAERRWENPLKLLEENVPGFNVVSYQHGGVADLFMIRGFTGGGHGSDAGLSLDGISLNEGESHADGYGDFQILIPLEIDSVQVYKGPISPLYGNFARGGVIAYNTRKTGDYADFQMSGGSYDSYDAQGAFGGKVGPFQVNGALQGYESEGYRDHSRYTRMNAAFRAGYHFTDDTEIAVSMRGHGSVWEGPNYILHDQFSNSSLREKENPFTKLQEDIGDKQFSSQRIDFNHVFSDNLKLLTWAYRATSDFTRFQTRLQAGPASTADPNDPNLDLNAVAPQTEYNHLRDATSIGASLNGTTPLFNSASNWVIGIEYYNEDVENLEWRTLTRIRQNQIGHNEFDIDSTALYGQIDMDISPRFRPTVGFRYDDFGGSRNDLLTSTRTDMNSYDHISPKLGFRSALTDVWELRASAANGFQLPQGLVKYDPSVDVDTVEIWQYEAGINGTPSPQWYFDLAAFMTNVSDEIQQPTPGVFVNAGETERTGIEGEIRYFPPSIDNLLVYTAFGVFNSEVTTNVANPALEGNYISSLPRYMLNAGISYTPPVGWGGSLRLRSLGPWDTNAQNTIEYDGHNVVNATINYGFAMEQGRSARFFLDINNLFDEVYSENVTGGPHPTQGDVPTSYSPRPPTNVMLGFMMTM